MIGQLNINSMTNKFEILTSLIANEIYVLLLSETKLDETFPLRRAYTMKFFFRDLEIFISKENCRNISASEMCVMKYYSVCSHNQVSFIRS